MKYDTDCSTRTACVHRNLQQSGHYRADACKRSMLTCTGVFSRCPVYARVGAANVSDGEGRCQRHHIPSQPGSRRPLSWARTWTGPQVCSSRIGLTACAVLGWRVRTMRSAAVRRVQAAQATRLQQAWSTCCYPFPSQQGAPRTLRQARTKPRAIPTGSDPGVEQYGNRSPLRCGDRLL